MSHVGVSWHLSSSEQDILTILNVCGSALSFLGSLFIMVTYARNLSFRNKLAFQLLFYVSIADMIRSFGNLWGDLPSGSIECKIQAFLSEYGGIASFFWIGFISIIMYGVVFEKGRWDTLLVANLKRKAHWIIWPLSLLLAFLPLTTNSYENTGGWCFIGHENVSQIWAFLCFYSWLWIVMISTVILYCRLYSKISDLQLHKIQLNSGRSHRSSVSQLSSSIPPPHHSDSSNINENYHFLDEPQKARQRMLHMVRRMFFYPSVLFICFFFPTLRRFWNFSGQDAPFWIVCLRVLLASLYGFGNSLIYTYTIWPKWRRTLPCVKVPLENYTDANEL